MNNLDILVPVKNEEGNILPLLQRIKKVMESAKISYRVIFVDDYSTDKTIEVLQNLESSYPIRIFPKRGQPGKAYSILEAVKYSDSEFVVMLDADLQYPPEAIPQMFAKAATHGVVVGNRKTFKAPLARRILSKAFNFSFGKILHGFNVDIQSGLKLFRREILEFIDGSEVTPWTLDLTLLTTARNLGFKIGSVNITFSKRTQGASKVNLVNTSSEIGKNALKLKFKGNKTYIIKPAEETTMAGAGIIHNKKWLRTHTTLSPEKSALVPFTLGQGIFIVLALIALEAGFIFAPIYALIAILGVLSFIYFIDVLFNFYVVLKSLHYPPEITFSEKEIASLQDENLPIYTILCPLYREVHMLPDFLKAIGNLNYPKNKLDVKLLLEEDDRETIEAIEAMLLPRHVSILVVPNSEPKTKPKACNYGLNFADGEYLVIYDAEDQPEPDQLKKAFLAFKKSKSNVVCMQAKLNYFNPHQNLLTRFFTAEYSLWFDVMLTGLQSADTVIPLGGTSNHFKTKTLLELEGWDPFNVTEDCDLGVRIFKKGYKTAIIDSTTLEEANSNAKNWLRQRSRWIKGYMQTYLVHMRNPVEFVRVSGWHSLIFQLIIGARISFMLINPILWVTTFVYFAFYAYTASFIESLFPTIIFYFAVFSLIAGNFLYIYNYMIGAAKRGQWSLIKYVFLVPIYWLMASMASAIALYQLIVKPHYWEKTVHGLHLNLPKVKTEKIKPVFTLPEISPEKRVYFGGIMLVCAYFLANVSNFLLNTYLGINLSFESFGLVSLFTGFLFLFSVPVDALANTISQKCAYLFGKYSSLEAKEYLNYVSKNKFIYIAVVTSLWFLAIPAMTKIFQVETAVPFILFSPVWALCILLTFYKGYFKGTLSFGVLAAFILTEAFSRLLFSVLIVALGYKELVYAAMPLALLSAFAFSFMIIRSEKSKELIAEEKKFDLGFYSASIVSGIAAVAYLSLDLILVKLFLSPVEAGKYGLLALVGKMIFFLGSLFNSFMIPIVSKNEGAKKDSAKAFLFLFGITFGLVSVAVIALGYFGNILVPLLLGDKANAILEYLPVYALAIGLLTISQPIVLFHQAKKNYSYAIASFLVSLLQVVLLSLYHLNLTQVVLAMLAVSVINLSVLVLLYVFSGVIKSTLSNTKDFFELVFYKYAFRKTQAKKILIFNWRDTEHVWAGGAEAYIFELAQRFVKMGNQVTIFSGNDGRSKRYEMISGVSIFRRGGFYTVYLWAALYYIFKFRKSFDVVIDSANGIPFFTPLFVTKPKFLLIHHVHQEVFRDYLKFPFSTVAAFIESKLMPLVYRNQTIVTVSESSRKEIFEKISVASSKSISVINPGINSGYFYKKRKTPNPSFLYLGRIKKYKNIDVIIKAFAEVIKEFPAAVLTIAGFGGETKQLKKLAKELNVSYSVKFLGKVSEKRKLKLLAKNWVMLQPSSAEGWGITVIEANASGTPVIASNINGLKDSVINGETGILVKQGSVEEFSRSMKTLILDKEYRMNLSEKAYQWAKNFEWEKSAQQFNDLLEEKIKSSKFKGIISKYIFAEGN